MGLERKIEATTYCYIASTVLLSRAQKEGRRLSFLGVLAVLACVIVMDISIIFGQEYLVEPQLCFQIPDLVHNAVV
jgi:hypothetical protein